jgi:penicillin amidase
MKMSMFRPVVALLLFAVAASAQAPAKTALPGLKGEVTVRRDARSIPYIEARSDADLYFAQGYETASDRLWQMDLMRRLARGETAEIFGQQVLEEDKRWRRFGFAAIAEESLGLLSPELKAALENYARGVNAYIATLDEASTPVEFKILQYKPRPWTPADTVVVGKILADALSSTWRNDLIRASLLALPKDKFADVTNQVTPYDVVLFGKDTTTAETQRRGEGTPCFAGVSILEIADADAAIRERSLERVGLYSEDLAASNNWVIAGKRTSDGKSILANDPHLSPTAPGIWYLTHLSTPTMRVSGVTFPGVPGIVLGHNEFIAWGATNVGPDVQDLYVETFNDAGEYKTPTGWAKTNIRKESINLRTNLLKPDTSPVSFDVVETRNGVIVAEDGGKKYALKWTARDPKNAEFEAFFALNRARTWDDFKTALKSYGGATQNFVYADVKGNIGWYAAGRIPIRRTGDGAFPYDGSTDEGEWTGFIPFDELPNLYNPASGLIVTANQRIVGTSYKYTQVSRDAAAPWRARRIQDELDAKQKITLDNVRDVQHDSFNIPLHNLAKEILKLNAAAAETLAVLKEWDGRMTPESRGAVLVNEIRGCIANRMADANKPAPASVIRERIVDWAVREQVPRWLPTGSANYAELIRSCDAASRTSLADPRRLGPDDSRWTWGRVWQSRFPHPLAAAPLIGAQFSIPAVPIDGSGQTPNVGSAVSMRHIASPGNWDATRHVIPLGQSGNPRSPHFKDQFDAWRTGTPQIFPFTKPAVEKATVGIRVLTPGG